MRRTASIPVWTFEEIARVEAERKAREEQERAEFEAKHPPSAFGRRQRERAEARARKRAK